MLHLIPAPLHRRGLRLAHRLRTLWWRAAKPQLVGVNVLLCNAGGEVLLVRHSYEADRWTLPGGGLNRGELPVDAARREIAEELGCEAEPLLPIGVNRRSLYGAPCTTHIFTGEPAGPLRPDRREVAEAHFFPRDALPQARVPIVDAGLEMLEQR